MPGRAKGSKNRVPSKSLQAQQQFAAMVTPRLRELFQILMDIAEDTEARNSDRIRAINELLDRSLGKAQQTIEIVGNDGSEEPQDTAELLNIFETAPEVPGIDEP